MTTHYILLLPTIRRPLLQKVLSCERGNQRLVEAHHQFWPSEEAMAEGNPQLILDRGDASYDATESGGMQPCATARSWRSVR